RATTSSSSSAAKTAPGRSTATSSRPTFPAAEETTMKAWIVERAGGPEVLTLADIPAPQAKADEVKIRVRAVGLNRAEMYRRTGMMGPIDGPVVLGIEAVGEVISDAAGAFRTGQRVATAMGGMGFSRPGSYAE